MPALGARGPLSSQKWFYLSLSGSQGNPACSEGAVSPTPEAPLNGPLKPTVPLPAKQYSGMLTALASWLSWRSAEKCCPWAPHAPPAQPLLAKLQG